MQHAMISPNGLDQDGHIDHENNYHNDNWVDMHTYSPMAITSYSNDYYMQPVTTAMPSESFGGQMAPPPPPQPLRHQSHGVYSTQLPHGLMIPTQQPSQVPWPSLRTNPSQSFSPAPVAIPPASAPTRTQPPKLPTLTTSQGRKTLTHEDRKAMCKFAEENPHVKQNEIGARFGVERRYRTASAEPHDSRNEPS